MNWKATRNEMHKGVKQCKIDCSNNEWICTIMMKVDAKIETLKSRPKKPVKEVLKQESIIEELNRLQDKYVFVPTDKASNNISIVCKECYIKTMLKKLKVFDSETNSNTNENITLTPEKIVEEHRTKMQRVEN